MSIENTTTFNLTEDELESIRTNVIALCESLNETYRTSPELIFSDRKEVTSILPSVFADALNDVAFLDNSLEAQDVVTVHNDNVEEVFARYIGLRTSDMFDRFILANPESINYTGLGGNNGSHILLDSYTYFPESVSDNDVRMAIHSVLRSFQLFLRAHGAGEFRIRNNVPQKTVTKATPAPTPAVEKPKARKPRKNAKSNS